MPGSAITGNFFLNEATVAVGLQANLDTLRVSTASLGLVKNFAINAAPGYIELTQGVQNIVVTSTLNSNKVTASMEVYEYTAANLALSLGLDPTNFTPKTATSTVATAVSSTAVNTLSLTSATGFLANDTIVIDANGNDDFQEAVIVSIASNVLTLDRMIASIPSGSNVYSSRAVPVGTLVNQPYLCARAYTRDAVGNPLLVTIPKMRITKGFNLKAGSQAYSNLPFEFQTYALLPTDPFYARYGAVSAYLDVI